MGRAPCCDKANVKKGPWSPEEDVKLKDYITKFGTGGNWISLPLKAGLKRCGKSCRLRWLNYLRPNLKHGEFSDDEDRIICNLFANIGSRWSVIAAQLPGRTDNDIKNYWNTKLKKKLMGMMIPPSQTKPELPTIRPFTSLEPISMAPTYNFSTNLSSNLLGFGSEARCCSSSDGSFSNQISYEYEQIGHGGGGGGGGGMWGETTVNYGIEEIKQLISTNSNNNNNMLFDQNKTESWYLETDF